MLLLLNYPADKEKSSSESKESLGEIIKDRDQVRKLSGCKTIDLCKVLNFSDNYRADSEEWHDCTFQNINRN